MPPQAKFTVKLEIAECEICSTDNAEMLFKLTDPTTECENLFTVVRCRSCALIYLRERPAVNDIGKFYPQDFVSYQFVVNENNGSVEFRDRLLGLLTRSMNMERINSLGKGIDLTQSTKVLDVGCGKGAFLYYLRKLHGCQAIGLDFDENCLSYCREKLNLNVLPGGVGENSLNFSSAFDLITMWAFLEHDFHPLQSLKQAHACLADNGLLIVEVPNEQSLEYRVFGKKTFLYDPPRHLYNFSVKTLSLMLEKAGFCVEKVIYPVGAGGWFGSFQRVLMKDRVYKNLKGYVFFLLMTGALIYPLELIMSFLKQGSVIRVFARKLK